MDVCITSTIISGEELHICVVLLPHSVSLVFQCCEVSIGTRGSLASFAYLSMSHDSHSLFTGSVSIQY